MLADAAYAVVYLAVCVCFTIAAYRRPTFAVAGLVLIDPFDLARYLGPTTITLPKVALIGAGIGLLLRRPRFSALRERGPALVAFACIAVVVTTAASVLVADYRGPVVRETAKATEYALLFTIVFLLLREEFERNVLANACFTVAAIVAVLAVAQELTGAPSALLVGHRAVPRIAGPLDGPNQLAGYCGLLLPLLVAFAVTRAMGWRAWGVAILTAVADFLTFSRAGVASGAVGVAAAMALIGVRSRSLWLAVFALPMLIGLGAVVLAGGDIARFWSTDSQVEANGLGTRSELWTAAYRLWIAHPWFGIGAGNYEFELGRVGFPELRTHPNGAYIQALVEGGFPLLCATLWATVQPLVLFVSSRRRDPWVAGAFGGCLAIALHQTLDGMALFTKVGGMLWILAGIGAAAATLPEAD